MVVADLFTHLKPMKTDAKSYGEDVASIQIYFIHHSVV